ncbi:hypothetical protein SDC9_181711 [bioreactor metagenome]|uniref:Uncharacterized protein n=1 Tax=bioreactor metagenome TaxID=1076179 RepID=A0A645H5D9_9ZZZZ
MQPFSPACGLIAAAASFGRAIPSALIASFSSFVTRTISARVASFGTSASGTWQVTNTMRKLPDDCIITKSRQLHSSAIRSVCPVNGIPARLTAYLFIGAVTIASAFPASTSRVASVSASKASFPQRASARPGSKAPNGSVPAERISGNRPPLQRRAASRNTDVSP